MNSFSYEVKKESAHIISKNQDEVLSELSAIIRSCGEITRNGNIQRIIITTELKELCAKVADIILLLYGAKVSVAESNDLSFSKVERYRVEFPSEITQRVLLDTEIMKYDENRYLTFEQGISKYLVQEETTERAFIRGAFISCFSCNISLTGGGEIERKSTGYHAEFVFNNYDFSQDFSGLLADFGIISKIIERKNTYAVYIKDFEMICDLLTIVGATKGVLKLQNENVYRDLRNKINRQNNCITGNLTKVVDASVRETDAINIIKETIGIEKLEPALQEAAYLRLANPNESLDSLVKLSQQKITKSGLYHRYQKIEKIAKEIK